MEEGRVVATSGVNLHLKQGNLDGEVGHGLPVGAD